MTEASRRRLELAQNMAAFHAKDPRLQAMLVAGSVARGEADDISDIDMCLYYSELPTEAEIRALREQVGGGDYLFIFGDVTEGGLVVSYNIEGIKHDFVYVTVERWERDMAEVLEQHRADTPLQKALSGVLDAIPLYGEARIAPWKVKAAQYPVALAEAMVTQHLKFTPLWVVRDMAAARGDLLWLYQLLAEAESNILGVLMGLNRRYHWGEYKRMDALIEILTIAPENLAARLKRILRTEPGEAVRELDALIEETFALVETYLPQADTTAAKQRYRRLLNA
jgi:predicted nucleotidyltransferase